MFGISTTVKTYPKLPYEQMKQDILGARYELSLVFVGSVRAQKLNKEYRKKTYIPNVLSFPLDERTGEIYIAPSVAAKEAKKFNMTPRVYIGYLFIHGLLHLKGYDHGDTMEKAEQRYLKKFKLTR
ncbi:MAG: rRNA maturation RNase YbeY [Candidatus Pacebacteria bacterium]|nr:rRNA maturation RNase YbeY [Candidatus Paceibacterota bacterium]